MKTVLLIMLTLTVAIDVQAQDTYSVEKRTPSMPSGAGKDWSPRYAISSDPPKAGYVVQDSTFRLEGDRQCGAYAECYKLSQDPQKATWEFRLQGHDEGGASVRNSTGVLTVIYKLLPLPSSFKREFWSPERWSARGKKFGCGDSADTPADKWCNVTSDTAPAGYTIKSVTFQLVGDRRCSGGDNQSPVGTYAECKQAGRNPLEASWNFRMQGHDEAREVTGGFVQFTKADGQNGTVSVSITTDGKAATSRGLLTVEYVRSRQKQGEGADYAVKDGDSLWKIARAKLGRGANWNQIYELNKGTVSDPNLILPGQVLKLPGQS